MKMHSSVSLFLASLLVAPLAAQDLPPVAPLPVGYAVAESESETEDTQEDSDAAETAEEELEQDDAHLAPAASQILELTRLRVDALAELLAAIVDSRTAATLAPQIAAACEALRNVDFSALAEEDEELVAAEFAEDMFIRLDDELARLADAGFFGDQLLTALFGSVGKEEELRPVPPPLERQGEVPVLEAGTESVQP